MSVSSQNSRMNYTENLQKICPRCVWSTLAKNQKFTRSPLPARKFLIGGHLAFLGSQIANPQFFMTRP
jgi:hypothetical protein